MLQKPIDYNGIDRDVPRKIIVMGKERYCPRCHAMVAKMFHPKFCGECGQKLSYQTETRIKEPQNRSNEIVEKFIKKNIKPRRRKR